MKKLLLSLVLFPVLTFGQKYEVGVNAGANFSGAPNLSMSSIYSLLQPQGKGGYAIGVSIAKNIYSRKDGNSVPNRSVWQAGLKVDAQQIRARGVLYNSISMGIMETSGAPPRRTIHLAEPAIAPMAFVNRKVNFAKGHIYFGVSAGPAFTMNNPGQSTTDVYLPKGMGYTIGGQIGYTHCLSDRFSLNAELSCRYYNISITDRQGKTNSYEVTSWQDIVAPITIGLRYTFGR